ncbi:MAG: choice-of-anchor E domain-containing protein [Planctomycetota bacterium]|nr:choice-of-anchor E domain-containing protein [Planctomycetota bacterium]
MTRFSVLTSLAIGAALFTSSASAQTQTVCFTGSIPLTNTNWANNVSVSKFDTGLGTLQSISFQLTGNIAGAVRIESLDTAATVVQTNFQATLTLTRPDLSVIVVTVPIANFNDSLTAFDGTTDFGGTSGVSHLGITANQMNSATSPPPASDLVLFSGPPGLPGNIVLPVTAVGSSVATGSGNLITQFQTAAAAQVQVCYTYLVNTPPTFGPPTPACNSTLMASAAVPFSFQICGGDTNAADTVTITSGPLPAGATLSPQVPLVGNPVCRTFNWTPTVGQIGGASVTFTITDSHGRLATCTINILVAECYQFIGRQGGSSALIVGGQYFNSQLNDIRLLFPVTMVDRPNLRIPLLTSGQIVFNMETVMHNPLVFPTNPDQWSQRLQVTVHPGQIVTGALFGTFNGVHQSLATFTDAQGARFMTFPFGIDGM